MLEIGNRKAHNGIALLMETTSIVLFPKWFYIISWMSSWPDHLKNMQHHDNVFQTLFFGWEDSWRFSNILLICMYHVLPSEQWRSYNNINCYSPPVLTIKWKEIVSKNLLCYTTISSDWVKWDCAKTTFKLQNSRTTSIACWVNSQLSNMRLCLDEVNNET